MNVVTELEQLAFNIKHLDDISETLKNSLTSAIEKIRLVAEEEAKLKEEYRFTFKELHEQNAKEVADLKSYYEDELVGLQENILEEMTEKDNKYLEEKAKADFLENMVFLQAELLVKYKRQRDKEWE